MVAVSHDYCADSCRTKKNDVLFLAYYVRIMWRACQRQGECDANELFVEPAFKDYFWRRQQGANAPQDAEYA
jgi:hypothetical protein